MIFTIELAKFCPPGNAAISRNADRRKGLSRNLFGRAATSQADGGNLGESAGLRIRQVRRVTARGADVFLVNE